MSCSASSRVVCALCILVFLLAAPLATAAPGYIVSSGDGPLLLYATDGTLIGDILPNSGDNPLGNPQHMVIDSGRLLVAGWTLAGVSVLDLDTLEVIDTWLPGAVNPAFLRHSPDGSEIWVSFLNSNRILRFDPLAGDVLGDLVQPGLIPGPHGIYDLPDGRILVASSTDQIYEIVAYDQVQPILTVPSASGRPTNMLLLDDEDTLIVTSFDPNTSQSVRKYSLSTGQSLGRFSNTQGAQADGLIRGDDGNIYIVFWGSQYVGKYTDDGTFLEYFVPPGSGLTKPNHILYVPGAPAALDPEPSLETGALENTVRVSAFPNPFHEKTRIQLASDVTPSLGLRVVDATGRQVRQLFPSPVNGVSESTGELGMFEAVWDGQDDQGADVPTGVYFVRVGPNIGATGRILRLR